MNEPRRSSRSLRRQRLGRSYAATSVLTAAAALLITTVVLIVFEFLSLRHTLIEDVRAQAGIVGANSAAALLFMDARAAGDTLSALHAAPYVEAAAVFLPNGQSLATYSESADGPPVPLQETLSPSLREAGQRIGLRDAEVAQAVYYQGRAVGTVYIRAGLQALYWRLAMHAVLILGVGIAALGVSLPLVARMKRAVVRAEAHLDYLAHTDPVTGLANRHAFNKNVAAALEYAAAQGGHVGLILLDLDNFKVVNDNLGHTHGDALLKAIAARLGAVVPTGSVLHRVGGDEFALVVEHLGDAVQLGRTAHTVLEQLAQPFVVDAHEIYATASIGYGLSPDDGSDLETLARNADTAMYYAKHRGKNACAGFRAEMNVQTQNRLQLERDLHRALERGEFEVHYQPQVSLHSGRIVGVEALLRWAHPQRGAISPVEFIPIAEACGLITALGRWVLYQACRQAVEWQRAGLGELLMSVNVSVRQLRPEHLLDDVSGCLRETGLSATRLELEITESMLMENVAANIGMLQRLRAQGVHISIDDFGTGYSSLSYLSTFPVTQLKIDRSFVQRIPGDGRVVTNAVMALARGFGLTVVAEGVERPEQIDFLRAAGCDLVQGWIYAPALTPARFAQLLASQLENSRPQWQLLQDGAKNIAPRPAPVA